MLSLSFEFIIFLVAETATTNATSHRKIASYVPNHLDACKHWL
jgi:hypothetical protein